MIVITGAAGFIGSNLITLLNDEGYRDLVLVDDFTREDKRPNWEGKVFSHRVERDDFHEWLAENHRMIQFVFHLGARTDTAEMDWTVFEKLNLEYSKKVWDICSEFGIPLVYASSAATYGDGKSGYSDDHSIIDKLEPLNPYGKSKNDFDKWVITRQKQPSFWAGLKFFNVYGPNEYHKGRMASVVFHAFNQIQETGKMNLFRSHNENFKDGEQLRDFIYVGDVCLVLLHLLENRKYPGIYNLGTGRAQTFLELVNQSFYALNRKPDINFIDTPEDIRGKYQYFTEADMSKLKAAGYSNSFRDLAEGVSDYIKNFLLENKRN